MVNDIFEGSDIKLVIDLKAMGFSQADDDYIITLYNGDDELTYTQDDVQTDSDGSFFIPVSHEDLHSGSLIAVGTVIVNDAAFPNGRRQEVGPPLDLGPIRKVRR